MVALSSSFCSHLYLYCFLIRSTMLVASDWMWLLLLRVAEIVEKQDGLRPACFLRKKFRGEISWIPWIQMWYNLLIAHCNELDVVLWISLTFTLAIVAICLSKRRLYCSSFTYLKSRCPSYDPLKRGEVARLMLFFSRCTSNETSARPALEKLRCVNGAGQVRWSTSIVGSYNLLHSQCFPADGFHTDKTYLPTAAGYPMDLRS